MKCVAASRANAGESLACHAQRRRASRTFGALETAALPRTLGGFAALAPAVCLPLRAFHSPPPDCKHTHIHRLAQSAGQAYAETQQRGAGDKERRLCGRYAPEEAAKDKRGEA
eukprot:6200887-Pleurochrysis_carterae.AAC.2